MKTWAEEAREQVKKGQLHMARAALRKTPIDLTSFKDMSGNELGVPEGTDIMEYIAAAKKFYDALKYESEHDKLVMQRQLERPVRFSSRG